MLIVVMVLEVYTHVTDYIAFMKLYLMSAIPQ